MERLNFENYTEQEKLEVIATASDAEKQRNFYEKLRKRLEEYIAKNPKAKGIEFLMLLPDLFYLLCKLLGDKRVSFANKLWLGAAILYCISPLDIIADFLPGGYTDDALVVVFALVNLVGCIDHEIIQEHWCGKENVIELIENIAKAVADAMANKNIGAKLQQFMQNRKQ